MRILSSFTYRWTFCIGAFAIIGLLACAQPVASPGQTIQPAASPTQTYQPTDTPYPYSTWTPPAPTATPGPTTASGSNEISRANQEYLQQIGVTAVLSPEEKAAAMGISEYMIHLTDCYMDRTTQALKRPRGDVLESLPYASEVFNAGATMGSEQMLTYQRQYLNRETLTALVGHCFEETYDYSLALDEKTITNETLEVSKAGGMVLHIGLLSPDMGYNCQEWIRTNHANYLSARAGSVKRRGETAGPLFDYAWGRAKETINAACAP